MFVLFRYLQTALVLALTIGDPTLNSIGYLFSKTITGRKNPDVELGLITIKESRKKKLDKIAGASGIISASSIGKSKTILFTYKLKL